MHRPKTVRRGGQTRGLRSVAVPLPRFAKREIPIHTTHRPIGSVLEQRTASGPARTEPRTPGTLQPGRNAVGGGAGGPPHPIHGWRLSGRANLRVSRSHVRGSAETRPQGAGRRVDRDLSPSPCHDSQNAKSRFTRLIGPSVRCSTNRHPADRLGRSLALPERSNPDGTRWVGGRVASSSGRRPSSLPRGRRTVCGPCAGVVLVHQRDSVDNSFRVESWVGDGDLG
jgi:hypothetical protein